MDWLKSVARRSYRALPSSDADGIGSSGGGDLDTLVAGRDRRQAAASHADVLRFVWMQVWVQDSLALKLRLLASFALLAAEKGLNAAQPLQIARIIDALHPGASWSHPAHLVLGYAGMRVAMQVSSMLRKCLLAEVTAEASRRGAIKAFTHVLLLDADFHVHRKTGGVVRAVDRGGSAVAAVTQYLMFMLMPTMVELLMLLIILTVKLGGAVASLLLLGCIVYFAWTHVSTKWWQRARRKTNELENQRNNRATDALLNLDTVRMFSAEEAESERYDRSLCEHRDASVRSTVWGQVLDGGQRFVMTMTTTAVLLLTVHRIAHGHASPGEFVLALLYCGLVGTPLVMLGSAVSQLRNSFVDLENVLQLLGETRDVQDKPGAEPLRLEDRSHGAVVEFDSVRFGYRGGGRLATDGVSFRVERGNTVALCGASGGGKSTLGKLLFRLYDADAGDIRIDGQSLRDVTQSSVRRAIGIVPQETVLFNDTLLANIRFGRPDATDGDVDEVVRKAQLSEFVARLPDGLQTFVGERGHRLSGGEKQRVGIARALLKDPPVMLLDEATSALDTATEVAIQQALREAVRGRTTVAIAHRLSTIADADEILVVEAGRVIERGRHADLLARPDGHYARMWRHQREEEEDVGSD